MFPQETDEEAPLLKDRKQQKTGRTPLPWRQLSIILSFELVEAFALLSIAPFTPQLVRDVGVTNGDETQVGYYVGLLNSFFFASQALTVLHWNRLSDLIGRKPVVLIGLCGLSASMYGFGLSKTFWGLVLSRSLYGTLNANIGIVKSMMAEITDSTNIAQAYAFIPVAWSSGASLGPYIGGSLSNPANQFPSIFGDWTFFKEYPYFLACAVPATFSAFLWLVTYFFLQETRRFSMSLSEMIKTKLRGKSTHNDMASTPDSSGDTLRNEGPEVTDGTPSPLRSLLTPRVLIAAGNYATLVLLDNTCRGLQPVFFSTPIELGGLGLDPLRIGNILSICGVSNGLFQVFFFARLHEWLGPKAVYSVAVASGVPLILSFPLLNALARTQELSWVVWSVVGMHIALSIAVNLGYSCVFIYIAAAPPNRASLGATSGVAQLLGCIMCLIGPAVAMSLFSISIKSPGHVWFAYYFMLLLDGVAIGASLLLPRKPWSRSMD